MHLKNWLSVLQARFSSHPRTTRRRKTMHRVGATPCLPAQTEILEDRALLTNFVVTTLDDNVAVDGFVSLREAIVSANTNTALNGDIAMAGEADGDTISFDPSLVGGTIILDNGLGQLEITDDLSIDGDFNDVSISGNDLIRIFSINTSSGAGMNMDVAISNLTLTNGSTSGSPGDSGGAIFISDGENVTLDTVTILNSSAAASGGAIFNSNGTLNVNNSQIGNSVLESDFFTNAGANVTDTVFAFVDDQNSMSGFGATLEVSNDNGLNLDSPFDPVSAGVEVDVAGNVFYEVTGAFDEISPYEIYTSVVDASPMAESEVNDTSITADPIMEDTLYSGNFSTGADLDFFSIMLGATDDRLVVMIDNDPEDNLTNTATVIDILDTDGSTVLSSNLFSGGSADAAIATGLTGGQTYFVRISSGGGVGAYEFVAKALGSSDLVAETESNNNRDAADGLNAAQYGQGSIGLGGANQAANGGGIFNLGGTLNLDFTTVSNNIAIGASADQGGGGIYTQGGTVLVDNSSDVSFNSATGASGSGGGIFVNGGMLTVMDSFLTNNTAVRAGGGIETRSADATVTVNLSASSVEENSVGSAPGNGGGLHVTAPTTSLATTVTITDGNFSQNSASSEGGGLWNDANGTMTINGVIIEDNTASGGAADNGGGGVFNNGGTTIIQNNTTTATTITGNIADGVGGSGGGILNDGGTLTINSATISGNTANRAGGGIEATTANSKDSIITLTDVTLLNNSAISGGTGSPGNGGGVHITDVADGSVSTFTATGGMIMGNSAAAEGGGLWNDAGGTMTLNDVQVTSNTASGNSADQGGGGIFNNGGIVTVENTGWSVGQISSNVADGTSGSGGGILNDGGTLNLINTMIRLNSAVRAGGGIEITTSNMRDSNVTMDNTAVQNNTVGSSPGNGGGLHVTDLVGDNVSTVTVIGGSFSGNSAASEGGGLWNDAGGTMTIRGTQITGNTASGSSADQGGGGIFNNGGTVVIQNNITQVTSISNNVADGAAGSGGGILNDGGTLTMTGGEISSNTAVRAGGGIEVTTANMKDSVVTLTRTNLRNNIVGSSPGNGGGVHITDVAGDNTSTFTMNRGVVSGNSAASEGGGLWNDAGGTMTINGTRIEDNTASGAAADQGGGGVFNNGGVVNINNSGATTIISGNIANGSSGSGGGILNDGGTLNITGATIAGNSAVRAGGGIEVTTANMRDSIVTLTNANLFDNTVGSSPGNGGGVHITDVVGDNTSTFTVTGGSITGNSAAAEGGGLWNDAGGILNIDGTLIESNTASGASADQGGGGVFNNGGVVNITSVSATTIISGNIADGSSGSGGGILNDGGTLNLTGVQIDGNAARRAGGGIEVTTANMRDSIVNVVDGEITNNVVGTAPGNGGGVHITDVAGDNTSTFTITGTSVTGNSATSEGGGLWNDAGGTMNINGVTITGNTASGDSSDQGGGGVFNNGGIVVIQNGEASTTTISNNVADGTAGSGGGILNDGGTLTITGSSSANITINNNTAVRAGGGIETTTANGRDVIAMLTNVTLSGNTVGSSPGNGGGVHITDGVGGNTSDFTITSSTVSSNSAGSEGGGLWNSSGGTLTVTSTTIDGNTASGTGTTNGGGGIFNDGGELNVTLSTISNNVVDGADGQGGGIFLESSSTPVDITTTTISGNTVTGSSATGSNGGGIFNRGVTDFDLDNSTISGNSAAAEGGGIWNGSNITLVQITVSGNSAGTNGGGIYTGTGGNLDIDNSTVTLNNATSGGGIFHDGGGTVTVESTIVAGNTANGEDSDLQGTFATGNFNLIGIDTGFTFTSGMNNLIGMGTPLNPGLEPLGNNGGPTQTHNLQQNSPAINGGSNPESLETDQRGEGFPRNIGTQTDIGAIEVRVSLTAVGGGEGSGVVQVFNSSDITGEPIREFQPYPGFAGAIRTAVADVNGDGTLDLITAPGPGGGPHIRVFSGADGFNTVISEFGAFDLNFTGGVFVAAANFNPGTGPGLDMNAEIVVSADAGGGPHVKVFNVGNMTERQSFFPYDPGFTGGVRVATGDISGDGIADIITGAGVGGGPHIRVFDGTLTQFTTSPMDIGGDTGNFFAFDLGFTGGVFVASGDINGDDRDDIIVGAGAGGGPNVRVFSGTNGALFINFFAYDPAFTGGVTVGVTQGPNGDTIDDIITGPGAGGGPHLKVFAFDGDAGPTTIAESFPFDVGFTGGLFVSGGTPVPTSTLSTLRFGGGEIAGSAGTLLQTELNAFVSEALVRLESEGASTAAIAELSEVDVLVADLEGDLLGLSLGGTVLIDVNAAGAGWFIDPSPADDVEFGADLSATELSAYGRIDLLTVLLHEFGHELGAVDLPVLDHPEHLMADTLFTGKRRLPNEDLDAIFAQSEMLDDLLG